MVRVFRRKHFSIYSDKSNHYIVHNMNKDFSIGHTHINNFNTAKFLVDLALHKSLPKKKITNYLLDSLIRISTDSSYICKIEMMKDKKKV